VGVVHSRATTTHGRAAVAERLHGQPCTTHSRVRARAMAHGHAVRQGRAPLFSMIYCSGFVFLGVLFSGGVKGASTRVSLFLSRTPLGGNKLW